MCQLFQACRLCFNITGIRYIVGADRIVPVASVAASRDLDASSSTQRAATYIAAATNLQQHRPSGIRRVVSVGTWRAGCFENRQAGDHDPLASCRLPSVLALEIKTARWPSKDPTETSGRSVLAAGWLLFLKLRWSQSGTPSALHRDVRRGTYAAARIHHTSWRRGGYVAAVLIRGLRRSCMVECRRYAKLHRVPFASSGTI